MCICSWGKILDEFIITVDIVSLLQVVIISSSYLPAHRDSLRRTAMQRWWRPRDWRSKREGAERRRSEPLQSYLRSPGSRHRGSLLPYQEPLVLNLLTLQIHTTHSFPPSRSAACSSRERPCWKRRKQQKKLLQGPLPRATWVILYPPCSAPSTRVDSSMIQWREVCIYAPSNPFRYHWLKVKSY